MEISTEYIKGWCDRQSQVSISSKAIITTAKTDQPIRQIYAGLLRLGILSTLTERKGRYELRIGRRKELIKFRDKIGFHCPDKAEKLATTLS